MTANDETQDIDAAETSEEACRKCGMGRSDAPGSCSVSSGGLSAYFHTWTCLPAAGRWPNEHGVALTEALRCMAGFEGQEVYLNAWDAQMLNDAADLLDAGSAHPSARPTPTPEGEAP